MIIVAGQMKNLRRGHDAQSRLKKFNLDTSYEGYSNYMALGRMKQIQTDVEEALRSSDPQRRKEATDVFTEDVLKPSTDTYLTAEWDEMVPFPTSKSLY